MVGISFSLSAIGTRWTTAHSRGGRRNLLKYSLSPQSHPNASTPPTTGTKISLISYGISHKHGLIGLRVNMHIISALTHTYNVATPCCVPRVPVPPRVVYSFINNHNPTFPINLFQVRLRERFFGQLHQPCPEKDHNGSRPVPQIRRHDTALHG